MIYITMSYVRLPAKKLILPLQDARICIHITMPSQSQASFTILDFCSSPIDFLIIIPSYVPKPIDTALLPLRGPCKIITGHIGIIIVIVIAVPLRSFAFSFALRICSLGGAGAPDGFRTLIQCWWLNGSFRCSWSWDSGGSSNNWRFRRSGDTFKSAAHALIVFELFGAVEETVSAKQRSKRFEGN